MADPSLIDISRTVAESTEVFPGDTRFQRRQVMAIRDGCSCNVSTITLSVHCGTHADAPMHFKDGAPASDGADLSRYVGRCRVVHTKVPERVELQDLAGIDLRREERLLFRTPRATADDAWREDFTYLSIPVARACAAAGVLLVGTDAQSVDPATSRTLEAHHALLAGGVAILENLDLSRVKEGVYELIALPLKIAGGDAAPVRAVLRALT